MRDLSWPRRLMILGSTGSIGQSTLDVVRRNPGMFEVVGLSAARNASRLLEQTLEFHPQVVSLTGDPEDNGHGSGAHKEIAGAAHRAADTSRDRETLAETCARQGTSLLEGPDALMEMATNPDVEMVVNALVGAVGILPTLESLRAGKAVALANKEVLVAAGEIVMGEAEQGGGMLLPVDSEHSAIHQCLRSGKRGEVKRVILTASGGALRERKDLADVTVDEALAHPTWNMGPKITIDSATLMNKGYEVIEAKWLFGLAPEQIEVVIHPQSIIHSLVEFADGSVMAQLSHPDMRLPIQYALTWPDRKPLGLQALDLASVGELTFENPDTERFPCLRLAQEAMGVGGDRPAALSAADEIAVQAALDRRLPMAQIPTLLQRVLDVHQTKQHPALEEILKTDRWARRQTEELLSGQPAGRGAKQ